MAGCRSLTDSEVESVLVALRTPRDKALFLLGLKTGFRISELLSLLVSDVYRDGKVLDRVRVARRNAKGKRSSRSVVLHPVARAAIEALLSSLLSNPALSSRGSHAVKEPLFKSREGKSQPLSRFQAHKIVKDAFRRALISGHVATHSMRKTFARRIYARLNHDLIATRDALGHVSIANTVKYLDASREKIEAAVLAS